jgi:hypothetical protein
MLNFLPLYNVSRTIPLIAAISGIVRDTVLMTPETDVAELLVTE